MLCILDIKKGDSGGERWEGTRRGEAPFRRMWGENWSADRELLLRGNGNDVKLKPGNAPHGVSSGGDLPVKRVPLPSVWNGGEAKWPTLTSLRSDSDRLCRHI